MTKRAKILIFLLCASFLLILYLLLTSEPVIKKAPESDSGANQADAAALEVSYRQQAAPIFKSYLALTAGDFTIDQLAQVKTKLLALRVPTKFKNLHVNLVLAMIKMEDYLSRGEKADKITSQQIVSQAEADYLWLNN